MFKVPNAPQGYIESALEREQGEHPSAESTHGCTHISLVVPCTKLLTKNAADPPFQVSAIPKVVGCPSGAPTEEH